MNERIKEPKYLHFIPWGMAILLVITASICLGYIYVHGEDAIASGSYSERMNMSLEVIDSDDYSDNTVYSDLYNVMDIPVMVSADGQALTGSGTVISEAFYNLIGYSTSSSETRYLMDVYGDTVSDNSYSILTGIRQNGSEEILLTLDASLQEELYQYMDDNEVEGFVIAYDFMTGAILSCVSTPGASSADDVSQLAEGSLISKALYSTPAGSTMKIISLICLADQGVDLNSLEYTCNGSYKLSDGSVINCTASHGTLTAAQAVGDSCNSWFAQAITENLDIDAAMDTLKALGFSVNSSEAEAYIGEVSVSPASIELAGSDGWNSFSNVWSMIGETAVLISPALGLQLSAACASGGAIMNLCFLQEEEGEISTVFDDYEEEIAVVSEIWKEGTALVSANYPEGLITLKSGTYEFDSGAVQKNLMGATDHIAFFIAVENYRDADGATLSVSAADIAEVLLDNLDF